MPPIPESEPKRRLTTPYTRHALEWVGIATFAGVGAGLIAIVWAMAYWAWTA